MQLPNFLLIGAYKAGTTSLHRYLREHPSVFMPRVKEPNFFALEGGAGTTPGRDHETNISEYHDYIRLFKEADDETALGEASPMYLQSPQAPVRIRHHIPHARLLVSLRDPADAIYSSYVMDVRDGHEQRSFSRVLEQLIHDLRVHPSGGPFYHQQLSRYYALFPRHQIKVTLYDDLSRDAAAVVQTLFKHLEVDAGFRPDTQQVSNAGGMPRNRRFNTLLKRTAMGRRLPPTVSRRLSKLNTRPATKLSQQHRARLIEIFREDMLQLQEMIQLDLGHWLAA